MLGPVTQNGVNLYLIYLSVLFPDIGHFIYLVLLEKRCAHIGKFSRYLKLIPLNACFILTISIFRLFKICNTFPCFLKQRVINIMSLALDYWGLNCPYFIVLLLHSTTSCIQQNPQGWCSVFRALSFYTEL